MGVKPHLELPFIPSELLLRGLFLKLPLPKKMTWFSSNTCEKKPTTKKPPDSQEPEGFWKPVAQVSDLKACFFTGVFLLFFFFIRLRGFFLMKKEEKMQQLQTWVRDSAELNRDISAPAHRLPLTTPTRAPTFYGRGTESRNQGEK